MTSPDLAVRLERWGPDAFVPRVHEAMALYAAAMGYHRSVVPARSGHAATHAERRGFLCVAALDPQDVLLGFGYCYSVAPGQWWHDQVERAVGRETARTWLPGALELCELHVSPLCQGRGIGRSVLVELLRDAENPRVLLSTPEGDTRAWRLYRGLGFLDVARRHLFPGDTRPFAVLGAALPLSAE